MATAVKRRQPQQEQQTKDGLSIGYRVIDTAMADSGGTLDRNDAIDAMLVQAAIDQGVLHSNFSMNRESPYSFTGSTSYRSVDGTPQAPPNDPLVGPYPKITYRVTAEPPAPKELRYAIGVIKAEEPDGTPYTSGFDNLTGLSRNPLTGMPQSISVTPPRQNSSVDIVFEGTIPTWYRDLVQQCAGKLNSVAVTILGTIYPPGHVMLLTASLTESNAGPERISLGYAAEKTTRTALGMDEVRPYSHVTSVIVPQVETVNGVELPTFLAKVILEDRVWQETSYDGLFSLVEPSP